MIKNFVNLIRLQMFNLSKILFSGLPPQHLYYSPPEHHPTPSPGGQPPPHKYHENGGAPGQDNFSDFVSLVCQEGPPGPSRSSKVSVSSYYSPGMYPPPPPMSRPVPLVRSSEPTSSPPVSSSPGHHGEHMSSYDMMPGSIIPHSDHHPPPHDGKFVLKNNSEISKL